MSLKTLPVIGVAVCMFVLGAAGALLVTQQVIVRAVPPPPRVETALVTVTEGVVAESFGAGATASRRFEPLAANQVPGTITAVADSNVPVAEGDVLYEVDALPVVAIAGEYPFYRSLVEGMEGPDVTQVRAFLGRAGYYGGAPEGTFTPTLTRAVKAWQRDSAAPETGVVDLGRLVAAGSLPAQIRLGEPGLPLRLGTLVSAGEPLAARASEEPYFSMTLTGDQAERVPPSANVIVRYADNEWAATVTDGERNETGDVSYGLVGEMGMPLCGDECNKLPVADATALTAEIVLTSPATGPSLPAAAVQQDETGGTFVRLADGTEQAVSILGQAGGVVLVDGVDVGVDVQLP